MKGKQKDIFAFLIIGILFIILFIAYNFRIPCIFHEVTGLYCPGCGGTRAIIALAKLDIYQAIRYNILTVIAIPVFCTALICKYIFKIKYKIPDLVWYFVIVIIIIYGILRNIPYFSFLAPTTI